MHRAAALLSAPGAGAARAKRRVNRPGAGAGLRQDEVPDLLARSRVDTGEIDIAVTKAVGRTATVPVDGNCRHRGESQRNRRAPYAYGEYGGDSYENSQ